MKFSESWLRTFVDPSLSGGELAHLLTMTGLEVEEMTAVAPPFTGVRVAEILEVKKHPDAERLTVCQVDTGEATPRQIVCGAPNAAAGLKVPCALPDACLPGDFRIKQTTVRGVESAGMLCSAKELGISDDASGLLELAASAPVGVDLRVWLDLDDCLFTLKLTPNRADCLSLVGIAREVSALSGKEAVYPAIPAIAATIPSRREIHLKAIDACPRYCGRIIQGVDARAPTPEWMRRRLERSGLRPVSALVDVTNYVLLELGQPLHAFDNAKLNGDIYARLAHPGEKLTLLNVQEILLASDVLVIADDKEAQAMAGIMGGDESSISLDTRDVFLESAFFAPAAIAGRGRRYNLASDAAHRFERGVDWNLCINALERATALVLEICGGKAGAITEAVADLPAQKQVSLRLARIARVLGISIAAETVASFLQRLALPFTREGDTFIVKPPSYRFDIAIEEDLIEEIARLYGYDNIPASLPKGWLAMTKAPETERSVADLKNEMVMRGFQEVINFAFVPEAWETDFADNQQPIRLANPIASQLSVMRSSLIGGLVETLSVNLKRKQSRVRIFEQGRVFTHADGQYTQPWHLAALAYGAAEEEGWGSDGRRVDFFDLKGDLAALFVPLELAFVADSHPALHPGRSARVMLADEEIGWIGELHPRWMQRYELPGAPILFEISLEAARQARLPAYAEISRFQMASRDLAIVVDRQISWQDILQGIKEAAPTEVTEILLFDLYQGKGVPEGKKSLAFRIVMQDTQRTLLDADMDEITAKITAWLENRFSARLRT
ncbi:MAG: phenylalanine--tRNA ligase subunit beta [Betaproteobacteria bacterium]|nr:phenylalanine--tRNA ligase subunit beta [Betaproteobacteria bacterium]